MPNNQVNIPSVKNSTMAAHTTAMENKLDALAALLEAQNHLFSHQNAAIDLLAADKRSTLATDIALLAELIQAGEILEEMDYGDQISTAWKATDNTEYTPAMNLCHVDEGELEDGEKINTAIFEWDKTTADGIPYSARQAIIEPVDAALPAGTYNFLVANDSWGNNNGKYIQFTLTEDLPIGGQIRPTAAYNALITSGTLDVYASGDVSTGNDNKLYSMTPIEGQGGTYLGTTDGTGNLNHWAYVAIGHARWSTSFARLWLNANGAKGTYWTKPERYAVKPAQADSVDGFLYGYRGSNILDYIQPCKVVTAKNTVDGGGNDVTYDRIFLASLEQIYIEPQASAGLEGVYWEYYKRLLGRTTPAPRSQTYARLIKYAINATTTAQTCWLRSAGLSNTREWSVNTSGAVGNNSPSYAARCAPACRIGK